MATRIITKNGSGAPLASDLQQGELAVDLTNKRLYTEDSLGAVQEVGVNPAAEITANAGIALPDNQKATFGASDDLQIYHDGSNSYVRESGAGQLIIAGSDKVQIYDPTIAVLSAQFDTNGSVRLYENGSEKLATTSTGIDVTGTVTADGLSVDGAVEVSGTTAQIYLMESDTTDENTRITNAAGNLFIQTTSDDKGTNKTRIFLDHATGDLSLYEDTGTTAKFFWDASAESLGIGTTSPAATLDVQGGSTSGAVAAHVKAGDGGATVGLIVDGDGESTDVLIKARSNGTATPSDSDTKLILTGDGLLGIGTSSPNVELAVYAATAPRLHLQNSSSGTASTRGLQLAINGTNSYLWNFESGPIMFGTGATERMRIDSSGNLLIGTTDGTPFASNVTGAAFYSGGAISGSTDGLPALYLNRKTSDGSIVDFRKDGSTVGSIGIALGDRFYFMGAGEGIAIDNSGNTLVPVATDGTFSDATMSLGQPAARYTDLYATNGTIQTSDANEKQDIDVLSEAEQRVAVAAKGLLRKFRWKSAVAEKGDDARIHFGIIAQDLQAAFEAEGLDAGDYAMFIHSTWTDEETGEERSRMGVRYSELLAFIIAAI
jgi:hypothetical protein